MKNIRQSVFETNSSSTHSISIKASSTGILDTITPDDNGTISLSGGTFGWEEEMYDDALTKANYCAVFADGDSDMTKMLFSVLKNHTGAKKISIEFSTSYKDDGRPHAYIDHQSARKEGGAAMEAFKTKCLLKTFIFSPDSILTTDNDNH